MVFNIVFEKCSKFIRLIESFVKSKADSIYSLLQCFFQLGYKTFFPLSPFRSPWNINYAYDDRSIRYKEEFIRVQRCNLRMHNNNNNINNNNNNNNSCLIYLFLGTDHVFRTDPLGKLFFSQNTERKGSFLQGSTFLVGLLGTSSGVIITNMRI